MRPVSPWLALLALALLAAGPPAAASDSFAGSMSVFGPPNRELFERAELLERSNMARGVELTLLGLAPGAETLKLTLRIVLDHRRVSRDKAQRARSKS